MVKIKEFKIGNRMVGESHPVLITVDISANHLQDFERAKELVKIVCELGVDAVKIQTYTPDTMTLNSDKDYFQVKVNEAWKGQTLHSLYQKAYTPWEWHADLEKIAQAKNVLFFSTAYDFSSVDFLEKMNVPCYKIASFEITDLLLLKRIAQTKKPVILSRGMANQKELEEALTVLRENGSKDIAILHCISSYPAKAEEMNLKTITDISERFGVVAGLSDHTLTTSLAVASVALGAKIIEKHFTLKRADGGPDAAFSLESEELKRLIREVRDVEKALGEVSYELGFREKENIVFRRSLWVLRNVKKGEVFTKENVGSFRPAYGLEPKYLEEVLGKKAIKDIEFGTPLTKDLIEI